MKKAGAHMSGRCGERAAHRHARRFVLLGLLVTWFVLALSASAYAATFHNPSPASGTVLTDPNVTISIGATATAGQTFQPAPNPSWARGTLQVDGGTPTVVGLNWLVTGWVWDDGAWDYLPVTDPSQVTFSQPLTLSVGTAHTVILSVTEVPSNQTFSYTWTFPAGAPPVDCTKCHGGYPTSHTAATMADCTACHTATDSPIYAHGGRWGVASPTGCDGSLCHASSLTRHDGSMLGAHTHTDLDGNVFDRPATPCSTCHTQSALHGSMAGSMFYYKDLQDAEAKREGGYDCTTCHSGPVGPAGISPHGGYDTTTNKCKVCHAVHRAQGAYYLLRADSQDDACSYCHIGGSAHSTKVVYDLNPAGIYTTNGHTIGAQTQVPDSSVRQWATPVTLSTTDANGNPTTETIQVRAYDPAKNSMYRFGRHHGQSDEGTGRSGYNKIGPLALRCMNCHQTHNAIDEVWKPLQWVGSGWPNPTQSLTTFETKGYKLLKRYPSASTTGVPNAEGYWNPGQQVKAIEGNAVPAGQTGPWGAERGNFSQSYSAAFAYAQNAETAAAPLWIAQDIHAPDSVSYPTPGTGYYRYPYFNSKYALSFWCADCHNLNLGGWEPLANPELGFKSHTERTHPAPFYGAYTGPGQCYSCHRNDLSPKMNSTQAGGSGRATVAGRDSCTQCHYGTKDYAIEMGNESVAGAPSAQSDLGLDFPHSGRATDIKLLGSYTVDVPSGGYTSGSFTGGSPSTLVTATITPTNLDAVCLRCHPGVGVHQ